MLGIGGFEWCDCTLFGFRVVILILWSDSLVSGRSEACFETCIFGLANEELDSSGVGSQWSWIAAWGLETGNLVDSVCQAWLPNLKN